MRTTEFWHESLTEKSWKKLQELSKEINLTVIGGWSVWLWTKQHKSKDIDILVDFETLSFLKEKYPLEKNDRLKKYEIKLSEFDIDIYTPYYSTLAIPIEDLLKETIQIEGIKTIRSEMLLILKQGAEIDRRESIKGQKDTIDILTLLVYAPIDLKKYRGLLEKYRKKNYLHELLTEITQFNPIDSKRYLGINYSEWAKKKKELIEKIKKVQ